jgi:regulator of sirC expression with transglutaminase-like and TPR domain
MLKSFLLGAAWLVLCWQLTPPQLAFGDETGKETTAKPPAETATKDPEPAKKAATPAATDEMSVEELVERANDSIVVVTFSGRDGKRQGLGTGFVVSEDGLIATNMHVIGEARPVSVEFKDGRKFDVTEIHATEKSMDLAVLRIAITGLKPLVLGDSDTLKTGQSVVAIGNPQGLRHSVVSGVVSEKREVDNKPMIQVAMPIERGNSGGPLLDRQGRVHGIITLKSQVTDNLGFAVVVNALKPLLEKPNPIPMSRWTTIGTLSKRDWKPLFGARWRQRAGRILVDDTGSGFGGRSLCLSTLDVPERPFELAVQVRFTPGSGAAGLVFQSDGDQKHYGFYPSNGSLRLTRFSGSSVYTWKVLKEIDHDAYRPDEWNTLKVRVKEDGIDCFINGELAIESDDVAFKSGAIGLAKFRNTQAEFRNFRVAKEIPSDQPSDETTKRIVDVLADLKPQTQPSGMLIDQLVPDGQTTQTVLHREALLLEQRARQLRELAAQVHTRRTQQELSEEMNQPPEKLDLLKAALLIARLDNQEVDVAGYLTEVDRIVDDVRATLPEDSTEDNRLAALNKHLFEQLGFHGSRTNYYSRSNSYLNEVIGDREGLPITLSLLYMELARRLDLKVVGIGLPGHFVVRYEPTEGDPQILDVFDQASVMSREDAEAIIRGRFGKQLSEEELESAIKDFLTASTPQSIIIRMLTNLRGVAEESRDIDAMLRYLGTVLVVNPDHLESRARRIDLQIRADRLQEAITDIDWMLEKRPEGMDVNRVLQLRSDLESKLQAM